MSKTAAQIALEEAARLKKEREDENEAWRAEQRELDKKQTVLSHAIVEALKGFKKVPGCKIEGGNTLIVNGTKIRVYTEHVTGTFSPCDGWPEEPYHNYLIRWEVGYGNIYGGISDVDDFNKRFGAFVASYLER